MPGQNEKIGGLEVEAAIDTGGIDKGIQTIGQKAAAATGSMKQLEDATSQLEQQLKLLVPGTDAFNQKASQLGKTTKDLEAAQKAAAKASGDMRQGFTAAGAASQALSVGLGVLGAQSIQQLIMKMIDLSRQSYNLALSLTGMEGRARAIFQDSFPKMSREAEKMGAAFKRSSSDMLEFMTGFATILDGVGVAHDKVDVMSESLTKLTVVLGNAFPDRSDVEIYETLSSALEGNARGLRSMGLLMTDKALQDTADRNNIKLKIKDMDDEQLVRIRTMFLEQESQKLQVAGIENMKKGITATKTFGAEMKDLGETVGSVVMPPINFFIDTMVGGMKAAILLASTLKNSLVDAAMSLGGVLNYTQQMDAAKAGLANSQAEQQRQARLGIGAGPRSPGQQAAWDALTAKPEDEWKKRLPGTGGGEDPEKKALEDAKGIKEEIDKVEKDILDVMGKQADKNKELQTQRRDDLQQREKMGIITKEESRELDRLNNRIAFGKDKVKEATDAWNKQADVVKKLRDDVQKYTDDIVQQGKELANKLADIDKDAARRKQDILRDAGRSKIDTAADMLKELKDLDDKLARGEGNSQEDQDKRRQIEDALKTVDQSVVDAGKAKAALNPFQSIDADAAQKAADAEAEAKQKKQDVAAEANKKLQDTVDKLTQANIDLASAESDLAKKRDLYTKAVDDQRTSNQSNYQQMEKDTQTHVAAEIQQWNLLGAKLDEITTKYSKVGTKLSDPFGIGSAASPAVKRAGGGPVFGAGTATSDSIPALLSNGEFVVNARSYSSNREIVEAINAGARFNLPRFALGGPVSHSDNHAKTIHLTQHNHGEAARIAGRPDQIRWQLRTSRW